MNYKSVEIITILFITFFLILMIVSVILLILMIIHEISAKTMGETEIPCYDEHDNVMVDIVCKKKLRCGIISFMNPEECKT